MPSFTVVDQAAAAAYAKFRIARDLYLKAVEKGINVAWKPIEPLFPYNKRLPDKKEVCGIIVIGNKETCEKVSKLPYNSVTGEDHEYTDEEYSKNKVRSYFEWDDKNNKCVLGDYLFRKWCEIPSARNTTTVHGQTDVPAFEYEKPGKCYITKDYCKWMGIGYDSDKKDCHRSGAQSFFEDYVVGKTIFRGIKKVTTNPEIMESFRNTDQILSPIDSRLIIGKKLLGKNFAGEGINLYSILWDGKAFMGNEFIPGFIDTELEQQYFPYIVEKNGYKHININRKDIQGENKNLKRIYLMLVSGDKLLKIMEKSKIKP